MEGSAVFCIINFDTTDRKVPQIDWCTFSTGIEQGAMEAGINGGFHEL
jgi:hypothetical protein